MERLAIFDFDGTLYDLDTFSFVVSQLKKNPALRSRYYRFMYRFLPVYILYKLKVVNKDKMVREASRVLVKSYAGIAEVKLNEFYRQAFLGLEDKVNVQVVEELMEARKQGYRVIIVSGAVSPLLEIAGERLGVERIFGTGIPIKDGIVCSKAEIDHIYGSRKLTRLLEAYSPGEVDWANSRAYADGISDLALLEYVGYPVAVKPDEKLAEVAQARNWRII